MNSEYTKRIRLLISSKSTSEGLAPSEVDSFKSVLSCLNYGPEQIESFLLYPQSLPDGVLPTLPEPIVSEESSSESIEIQPQVANDSKPADDNKEADEEADVDPDDPDGDLAETAAQTATPDPQVNPPKAISKPSKKVVAVKKGGRK